MTTDAADAIAPGVVHLVADAVSFAYPGRPVLDRVTVAASAGQRIGVVGENGAGKSTLLHVLAGVLEPQSGAVRRAGSLALVTQELVAGAGATIGTLVDEALVAVRAAAGQLDEAIASFDHSRGDLAALTGALARVERLAGWDADRRMDEALTRFGAVRDAGLALADLSVGERYRVRLACQVAQRADVLLLDEPTNHLDEAGIDYLTAKLREWPGVVVIVTHDRQLLDEVMTAILDLDPTVDGRPALYGATRYATYRFAKDQAERRWRRRYAAEQQRRAQLLRRLDESYEGLSDAWRPPKGSQSHGRATHARVHVKAADRLVQRLEAAAVEIPAPPLALAFPDLPTVPAPPAGPGGASPGGPLLEVRAPLVPGRLDLAGTRISLPPCGRLLVTGPNGSGKSTLLAALAGTIPLARGTRTLAHGVRVGVLAQDDGSDVTALPASATGFDTYARAALDLLAGGALDPGRLVAVAFLGLLTEDDLDRPLSDLSVGQRRRFELARALLAAPHVLILDEPTNHLSIALVDELTAALRATSAAVVVATHDRKLRADLSDWPALHLPATPKPPTPNRGSAN